VTTFRETYDWMRRALDAERKLAHVEKLIDCWAEQSVTLKPSSGTPTQNGIDANLAYCARELRDVLGPTARTPDPQMRLSREEIDAYYAAHPEETS
jgi:hypothetical protein